MCAEPIFFDENGRISEVVPTSIGMGKPYSKGEKLYGYQACGVSGSAYISGDRMLVKKGKAAAVYRYIDTAQPVSSVEFAGDGSAALDFEVEADGTLTVNINAETDVQIDYFILS